MIISRSSTTAPWLHTGWRLSAWSRWLILFTHNPLPLHSATLCATTIVGGRDEGKVGKIDIYYSHCTSLPPRRIYLSQRSFCSPLLQKRVQMLVAFQAKSRLPPWKTHKMFLDTNFNSIRKVLSNIYQNLYEAAMKYYRYVTTPQVGIESLRQCAWQKADQVPAGAGMGEKGNGERQAQGHRGGLATGLSNCLFMLQVSFIYM